MSFKLILEKRKERDAAIQKAREQIANGVNFGEQLDRDMMLMSENGVVEQQTKTEAGLDAQRGSDET